MSKTDIRKKIRGAVTGRIPVVKATDDIFSMFEQLQKENKELRKALGQALHALKWWMDNYPEWIYRDKLEEWNELLNKER